MNPFCDGSLLVGSIYWFLLRKRDELFSYELSGGLFAMSGLPVGAAAVAAMVMVRNAWKGCRLRSGPVGVVRPDAL